MDENSSDGIPPWLVRIIVVLAVSIVVLAVLGCIPIGFGIILLY